MSELLVDSPGHSQETDVLEENPEEEAVERLINVQVTSDKVKSKSADINMEYFKFRKQDWSHITTLNFTASCQEASSPCFQGDNALTSLRLISLLTQLQSLTIKNYSDYIKTLPSLFCRLVNLEELDVSGNSLDTLPSSLQLCQKLKFLNISRNYMTSLPAVMLKLPSLQTFYRNGNHMHDSLRTCPMKLSSSERTSECTVTPESRIMQSLQNLAGEVILRSGANHFPKIPQRLEEDIFEYWVDTKLLLTCEQCGKRRGQSEKHFSFLSLKDQFLGNTCLVFGGFACSSSCAKTFMLTHDEFEYVSSIDLCTNTSYRNPPLDIYEFEQERKCCTLQ